MHSTIIYVAMVLSSSVLLFKASESWWSSGGRETFKERTAELWLSLAETQRHTQTKSFLAAISALLDRLYGSKTFSMRAFWRTQLTTTLFYVVALAVIGLRTGVPLSMENPPWQGYDFSFELTTKFFGEIQKRLVEQKASAIDEKARNSNQATQALFESWSAEVSHYRSTEFRTIHSVGCLAFAILLSGVEAFVGLAISRQLLRDLTQLASLSSAFAVIASEVLLYSLLHGTTLLLLTVAAIPVTVAALAVIFGAFWYVSQSLGIVLLLLSLWGLGLFAPLWIKVAASVSSLPVAVVTLAAVGVILLKWLGWPAQRVAVVVLDRALRSEKGPATFFTSVVILLAGLLAILLTK